MSVTSKESKLFKWFLINKSNSILILDNEKRKDLIATLLKMIDQTKENNDGMSKASEILISWKWLLWGEKNNKTDLTKDSVVHFKLQFSRDVTVRKKTENILSSTINSCIFFAFQDRLPCHVVQHFSVFPGSCFIFIFFIDRFHNDLPLFFLLTLMLLLWESRKRRQSQTSQMLSLSWSDGCHGYIKGIIVIIYRQVWLWIKCGEGDYASIKIKSNVHEKFAKDNFTKEDLSVAD